MKQTTKKSKEKQQATTPKKVLLATNILYGTLVVGLIHAIIYALKGNAVPSPTGIIIMTILSTCLSTFFVQMIKKGKNWARVLYLIGYIFGVLSLIVVWVIRLFVPALKTTLALSKISLLISIPLLIIQTIALRMLFQKESTTWFTRNNQNKEKPLKNTSNNFGVAGLVLGIVTLMFFWIPIFGVITGTLGIIFSGIQIKRQSDGIAIGGLVTSILGLIGAVLLTALIIYILLLTG